MANKWKEPKRVKTVRLSPLAHSLVAAEKARTGESEGEIIERCVFGQIQSPEAMALIRAEVARNPNLRAIVDALMREALARGAHADGDHGAAEVGDDAKVKHRGRKKTPVA